MYNCFFSPSFLLYMSDERKLFSRQPGDEISPGRFKQTKLKKKVGSISYIPACVYNTCVHFNNIKTNIMFLHHSNIPCDAIIQWLLSKRLQNENRINNSEFSLFSRFYLIWWLFLLITVWIKPKLLKK